MRQKNLLIAVFAAILLAVPAMVQSKKGQASKAKTLEVAFNYQKQPGPGSNQYAVWIENEKGEVVKTLFVTAYTTKGRARSGEEPMRGYVKRPNCVPTWVKAAKAEEQSDQQLDAVTGATPKVSGVQTFTWNFTDQQGRAVPQGTYKVFIEATLYQASDIIYTGTFSTRDKAGEVRLSSTLTKPDENHQNMVSNVKAVLK